MRLLLADADLAASRSLCGVLRKQGWVVDSTDTAEELLDLARHYDYDAVLLAQDLPDMPGHEAVRRLRLKGVNTPAVVLSDASAETRVSPHPGVFGERGSAGGRDAEGRPIGDQGRGGVSTVVRVLSAGADDVLPKKIDGEELVARLRAITRRARGHARSVLAIGPVTLNQDTREVHAHGQPVRLTNKEFALFELLVLRKGAMLSKDAILNHLYDGMDEPEMKIVDVFVCKLRKKLADAGAADVIGTVWGRGYIARDPAISPARPPRAVSTRRDDGAADKARPGHGAPEVLPTSFPETLGLA